MRARQFEQILNLQPHFKQRIEKEENMLFVWGKLGGAGDRFSDYLCVDSANLPNLDTIPL